jgi:tagatose-6-phosphate ketose/aldose isomerase
MGHDCVHQSTLRPPGSLSFNIDGKRKVIETELKPSDLLSKPEQEQHQQGYFYTLREIWQQPDTLRATCEIMLQNRDLLSQISGDARLLLLTGSGSSEYAGDCVRLPLQNELRITAQTIPSGMILTHGSKALPPGRPALMLSLARSGDSPESVGALSFLLEAEPEIRHLILTCNRSGRLAERFREHPRVSVIVLDERTNDRSLVMTSSFTSLALAARFLGLVNTPQTYRLVCERLSRVAERLIEHHFGMLARLATTSFRRAVFLASGARFAAAREASLKMLEMTAGRVTTLCETYLGLRHGPMSYVQENSLIVCSLSSDPLVRAYEVDLIRELDRKGLGMSKLIIGEGIPQELVRNGDVALECAGLGEVGDENACIIDVLAGQLLGFFRCLKEGFRPDSPSEHGVITRVVETFTLHSRSGGSV